MVSSLNNPFTDTTLHRIRYPISQRQKLLPMKFYHHQFFILSFFSSSHWSAGHNVFHHAEALSLSTLGWCISLSCTWLVMSGSCRGFFPPKTADTPTCRRHVADTTQTMSATLHRVGSPDVVSVSCRHDDLPTCRRITGCRQ